MPLRTRPAQKLSRHSITLDSGNPDHDLIKKYFNAVGWKFFHGVLVRSLALYITALQNGDDLEDLLVAAKRPARRHKATDAGELGEKREPKGESKKTDMSGEKMTPEELEAQRAHFRKLYG